MSVHGSLHPIGSATSTEPASEILAQDHRITVINAATGEVLRDFTLDPTGDYQPTAPPKGKITDLKQVRGDSDVLRHHKPRTDRI